MLQSTSPMTPESRDLAPRRISTEAPVQYMLASLTVVLVAAPIIPIIYQAFIDKPLYDGGDLTLANFERLFTTSGFLKVVGETLLFAFLSTAFAQTIGSVAAILVGRTDIPGSRLLAELFLWPLYVSSLILSFAWATVYGPSGYVTQLVAGVVGGAPWDLYTRVGMSAVAGVSLAPVSFIYAQASARTTDPTFEEAARIAGAGKRKVLLHITLPLMKPALFFSTILVFTSSLEILSIPLVFGTPSGIRVLSTFLYERVANAAIPEYGIAAAAALMLVLLICGLIALQNFFLGSTRKYETIGGKAARPRPFQLGAYRWVAFALLAFYIVMAVLAPLGVLILRGFVTFLHPLAPLVDVATFDNYRALWQYPAYIRSIWNSLFIASFGGAMATALVVSIALIVHRSSFRFSRPLLYVALLPRAIPGLIAGIGFFYAIALIPGLSSLRSTVFILIIAFTMAAIPQGYGAIAPMLLKISPELDRAARVQGASWNIAMLKIIVPIMRPALIACFAILFISFFKEYSTAVFLYSPGSEVIGTTLLQFWTQGHIGYVAALSTVQITIIAACIFLARQLFGVKIYG